MNIGLLLSGGVDSSAALMTLLEQGHKPRAYYLKIWLDDELASLGTCPWEEDLSYARAVCQGAGVSLQVISLQQEYWDRVVSYVVSELKSGRTPSPDIFCNQRVKFGAFLDRVGESLDRVASGHYALVNRGADGLSRISRSPDPVKDQTYFLSHLSQEQAALAMFPLGSLYKEEVRRRAIEWQLPNQNRPDSQGICFLGKLSYPDFIRHYLGERKGPIVEKDTGRILGEHKGFWFYTIGQRSGLGLSGGPWFVVEKDTRENKITVAGTPAAEAAARDVFFVVEPHWIAGPPPGLDAGVSLSIKLRHGPQLMEAVVTAVPGTGGGERLRVKMNSSDRGIAPGQFAVFYQGELCLGGARME